MKHVTLRSALAWDCPECSAVNFIDPDISTLAEARESDPDGFDDGLREALGLDPWESIPLTDDDLRCEADDRGLEIFFAAIPDSVLCACGTAFAPRSDEDEED